MLGIEVILRYLKGKLDMFGVKVILIYLKFRHVFIVEFLIPATHRYSRVTLNYIHNTNPGSQTVLAKIDLLYCRL